MRTVGKLFAFCNFFGLLLSPSAFAADSMVQNWQTCVGRNIGIAQGLREASDKVTVAQMAKVLRMSVTEMNDIKKGKAPLGLYQGGRLSQLLGVGDAWLMCFDLLRAQALVNTPGLKMRVEPVTPAYAQVSSYAEGVSAYDRSLETNPVPKEVAADAPCPSLLDSFSIKDILDALARRTH
jgi:hypothetical protein